MFTMCAACGSRVIAGGEAFLDWRFCDSKCMARFQATLADKVVPKEVMDEQINGLFGGACPVCGRQSGNDLHDVIKVTGLMIFYEIEWEKKVCCANCGRKERLLAALHCLFLGWWEPRAACFNLFALPMNLIAAVFIRKPKEPSQALKTLVKTKIVKSLVS